MIKGRWISAACLTVLAGLGLVLASPARAQGSGSATLDAARARGYVACGASGTIPAFRESTGKAASACPR